MIDLDQHTSHCLVVYFMRVCSCIGSRSCSSKTAKSSYSRNHHSWRKVFVLNQRKHQASSTRYLSMKLNEGTSFYDIYDFWQAGLSWLAWLSDFWSMKSKISWGSMALYLTSTIRRPCRLGSTRCLRSFCSVNYFCNREVLQSNLR